MDPERWQQVKAALAEALALGEPARAAYVQRLGATDPALCAELESLLRADEEAGTGFLESPAAAVLEAPSRNLHVGRRLGPYRLLEEIGAGGMGEVYRAVRVDEEYEHEVAVKLVRAGADARFIAPRLRTERQILAAFQHPNIARLLDGGTTEEGIPYLVMELIAGQPITDYCDRHRLDLETRLHLFLLVCSAVQYAHQRAVIHRDLKPSNILVTAEGMPKLLDFGIAKILEPGSIPVRGELTVNAIRLLTPDYASPEQLKGEPVTAASDVYSLGVILYELLTGLKPHGGRDCAPQEGPRVVLGAAPTRPSLAVRGRGVASAAPQDPPERLSRHLRGDLDNIALMALRQEPERRYATVDRLAEDLRRYLGHRPVAARSPTLRYRASMFVRRHKVGVTATALTGLALLVGIAMTARETVVARAALARAEDEARASQRVSDYLVSLFEEADPEKTGGKPLDVRTLAARAQSELDPHLSSQPEVRARMLSAVGALHCEIGQFEPCEQDLEAALRIEKAVGSTGDTLLRAQTEFRLAQAYDDAGRTREALVLLQHALPTFETQQPLDRAAVAAVWDAIGEAYLETDPLRAIAALQRARALGRGPDGKDTVASIGTLGTLAIANAQAMRWNDALALARARVDLVRAHFNTADVRYFDALNDYAEVAQEAGRFHEARQAWEQVLGGYERIFGRGSDKYIDTELSIGDVLFRRNRLRESILWFRRSIDDYRAQESLHRERYIGSLFALSQVLWMYGDYRGAASAARKGFRTYQQTAGGTPQSTAVYSIRLAHPLAFVGETQRALQLLSSPMPGDPRSALTSGFEGLRLLWLGDTYRETHADGRAEQAYDRAIAYLESHSFPHSAALSMAYEGKALLLAREKRFAEAVPLYRLAIAGYANSRYAPNGPTIAATQIELAASLASLGRLAQARALISEAGATVDAGLAPTHPARLTLTRLRKALRLRTSSRATQKRSLAATPERTEVAGPQQAPDPVRGRGAVLQFRDRITQRHQGEQHLAIQRHEAEHAALFPMRPSGAVHFRRGGRIDQRFHRLEITLRAQ
ncbi:MAG: protein kinase domain-containing protein [Steroidobacteraceae bacterium]